MENTYQWSLSQMETLKSSTTTAYEAINTAMSLMNALVADIEADSQWTGDHKLMFAAWMELLKQYHAKIAAQEIGEDAANKLGEFTTSLASFYTDSPAMASLRSIS